MSASRGAIGVGRLLVAIAVIECLATIVRAALAPDPTPAVLSDLAAVSRAVYAAIGTLMVMRLRPLARANGLGLFTFGAALALGLAAALGVLPLLAVVPRELDDATWDALIQLLRAVFVALGVSMALFVGRALAERNKQPAVARHLAWTSLPLVMTLPIAFQAIDPALVPAPWLGPALALALPWAMVAARLMRWDVGLWVTLAELAVAGTILFGPSLDPLALPSVALCAALVLSAIAASGALYELAPSLEPESADAISRTFIRRLFDGTLGGDGGRVGDLDPDRSAPKSEAEEDAEQLARAYAELGIKPPSKTPAPDPIAPEPIAPEPTAPLPPIAPLVPKSKTTPRPVPVPEPVPVPAPIPKPEPVPAAPVPVPVTAPAAPVPEPDRAAPIVLLPTAWSRTDRGLRWVFASLVARVLTVVFGFMWSSSPLAEVALAVHLFDLALVAGSVALMVGAWRLRDGAPPVKRAATATVVLAATLVALDVALFVERFVGFTRDPLLIADGLVGFAAIAAFLVHLALLQRSLDEHKLAARARNALALLFVWGAILAGAIAVRRLPESDLQWLAWPLGFAAAAVGLGLWVSLLWLVRDARDPLHR